MHIYITAANEELIARQGTYLHEPFRCFIPQAQVSYYELPDGKLAVQELESELFSIGTCEAVLEAEQRIDVVMPATRISLFFTLKGSVTIRQGNRPAFTFREESYTLAYWPETARLSITLPKGNALLFRIDYSREALQELADDFPPLQSLKRAAAAGSSLSRRLCDAAIDSFVRVSIRQMIEYGETKSERSLFIYARCLDLLRYYVHSLRPPQLSGACDEHSAGAQLALVKAYIDQHLDTALSMDKLARSHNLSVRSMERYFSRYYRQSIGRYILVSRMAKAQELLRETTLPLLKIALMVGYSELSNFTRAFKGYYGYQPSRLRN